MQSRDSKKLEQLESFAQFLSWARFFRFVLFFYSFIAFVFWFLNCLEVDWLYLFEPLFQISYQIVSTFYKPQGIAVDFSLAIIGGITLGIGIAFDFMTNNLYENILDKIEAEERKLRNRRQQMKQRYKNKSAANNETSSKSSEQSSGLTPENPFEDSKLLFLIMPHINKIKKKKDDLELTFQEVEIWKQRINKRLIENLSYSKPIQKGYYRKNLFFLYKDFNFVDDFLYYVTPTTDSIILEFKKYGIKISFCYVFSAIASINMLEKELECMDTILALNFLNEYTVTNRFKITYEYKPIHKYALEFKGEYNLSKNLSVSHTQSLFKLVKEKNNDNENYKNGT